MNAKISHAPGRFAVLLARMLKLELEREGVSASILGGAKEEAGLHDAEIYIYVDDLGNAELVKRKLADPDAPQHTKKLFRYPFRVDAFMKAALFGGTADKDQDDGGERRGVEPKIVADGESRHVFVDGAEIALTEREYRLFCYLYERRGRPVSRDELIKNIWRGEAGIGTNVVEVYVSYLRHKLEGATGKRLIITRRGKGYEFRAETNPKT